MVSTSLALLETLAVGALRVSMKEDEYTYLAARGFREIHMQVETCRALNYTQIKAVECRGSEVWLISIQYLDSRLSRCKASIYLNVLY